MAKPNLTQAEINELLSDYQSNLRKLDFERELILEAISKLQKQTGVTETPPAPAAELPKPERKKPGPKPKAKPEAPKAQEVAPASKRKGRKSAKAEPVAAITEPPVTEVTVTATPAPKTRGRKKQTTAEVAAPAPEKKGKGGRPRKQATAAPVKEKKAEKAEKAVKAAKAPKTAQKASKTEKTAEKAKPGPKPSYNKWDLLILKGLKKIGKPMSSQDLLEIMKEERDAANEPYGDTTLGQFLNRSLQKLGKKQELLNTEPYSGKGYLYSLKDPKFKIPEA